MGLTYKAIGVLAGLTFVVLSTGCGAPGYCKQVGFNDYLDNEWRVYCAAYLERVERPAQFEIQELTRFFANHPDRAAELRQRQDAYQDVSACFETPREQYEYKSLASCLNDDEAQRNRINKAWQARADAWIQDYESLAQRMGPRVEALQREATRLMRKAKESFEYKVVVEPDDFLEWQVDLRARGEELARLSAVQDEWRPLVETAGGNEALREVMLDDYGPRVARLSEEILEFRDALVEAQLLHQYLENSLKAAGRACPDGIRARREARIARSVLSTQIESIDGGAPRIDAKITPDERGDESFEFFSGFVCGERGEDQQIKDQVELCAMHRFVLERKKPKEQRKWEDWTVKSFEEGGPDDSVDCSP